MEKLILHFLKACKINSSDFNIKIENEKGIKVINISILPQYYPIIIGKGGSTIKALSVLANFIAKKKSLSNIYLRVQKIE